MKLRKKRQGVNRFGTCCFRMLLLFILSITVIELNGCIVNAKAKEGTRIKVIKQDIGGKEQIIGCSQKECVIHKNKRYGEKSCASGSDLFNIQVKTKKNGKIKYKSLYQMEFISMQGGCIKGNNLYLAFSDVGKSTPEKEDLTAIVRINLKESKVKKVTLIRGAVEKNIDGLGHANDLTYQNGKFHAAWYMTKGTGKTYSNKIGYINKQITGKGIGAKFSTKMGKTMISAFGIAAYPKKLVALGIRYEDKKMYRYISAYTMEKKEYKKKKKLFSLTKNKNFSTPQCMEYYKKFFYVVRFNTEGGKKNNNCVEIYSNNGKRKKIYTIRDPKTKVTMTDLQNPLKTKIKKSDMKTEKWEIESFSHYKGNTFYYTQFKPDKRDNKQAYLYKINLKAKAKSTDKKASKNKKKANSKKNSKTKKKTQK